MLRHENAVLFCAMTLLASGGRDEHGAGWPGEVGGLRLAARWEGEDGANRADSATPAATRMPIAIALTKALCAAPTSSLPCSPPMCLPMLSAAATELVARWGGLQALALLGL